MPNLQVKDIDEKLYDSLKKLAANEKRSISQEVVIILQKYLSIPKAFDKNPTEQFLELAGSWKDEKSADEIVADIRKDRNRNMRKMDEIDELFN